MKFCSATLKHQFWGPEKCAARLKKLAHWTHSFEIVLTAVAFTGDIGDINSHKMQDIFCEAQFVLPGVILAQASHWNK